MILLAKVVVTLVMILLLSAVAEYANPRLAGIFSGYPIGSAIVLYFYGLERGVDFAAVSASYNLVGLVPSLAFALVYFFVLRRAPDRHIAVTLLLALGAYASTALLVGALPLQATGSIMVSALALLFCSCLVYGRAESVQPPRLPLRLRVLVFRVLCAATLVISITALAGLVGPRWAGILSGFPLILLPLVVIVHLHLGAACARSLLSHFPIGLWSVFCYSLTLVFAYPKFGLQLGTLVGFLVATLALLLLNLKTLLATRKSRQP
ncbi:MAG: hypothetical protein R6W66_00805 [Pelovirga sp.]